LTGALDGLRVIELADEQAEWAGKLLADMGADVVKVELPEGARTRSFGPFVADQPGPERSLHFWHYNTSKRSVTLNLDSSEGRALFLQLTAAADVLIETTVPGALDRLGLGYKALATANPRLVVASVTPWGQDGPYSGWASGDIIQMAMGGIINSCGYDDHDRPPVRPGQNHAYHLASHHAVIALLTALHARARLGYGQHIDVATHDCVAVCTEFAATYWFYTGTFVERQTGRHATPRPTARTQHATADGRWINYSQTQNEVAWQRFLAWADGFGVGDLFRQFGDAQERLERASEVMECARAVMATLPAEEIWQAGQRLGMPWGAVRRPEDWLDDPHAEARGFFQAVEHEGLDQPLRYPGPPYAFTGHPGVIRRAPHLGEHNATVYGALGYSADEIAGLHGRGAI
jgi:crotonobetainyl-CoA:carnitine CoA-transferase CaiB-like acyl-CoA transferase